MIASVLVDIVSLCRLKLEQAMILSYEIKFQMSVAESETRTMGDGLVGGHWVGEGGGTA